MPARFRVANEVASSLSSERDLEEQLQRRLRLIAALWAIASVTLSVVGLGLRGWLSDGWRHVTEAPGAIFTAPPYFGYFLLVAAVHAAIAAWLAPTRRLGLPALRALEGAIVALPALLFVAMADLAVRKAIRVAPELAIILAMGFAAPWMGMMIVYGVFVPNTWRRCAVGVALLFVAALVPDVLVVRTAGVDAFHTWLFLATKTVALAATAVLAIYGAYRIEELQQDARDARQLGQYVLRDLLGAGGMGEVYLAEHQFLRRPCAVKLIHPARQDDASVLLRFEREVQATAALTHPNTVQIFDYGHTEDGTFYYAMEYLPGLSLEQLVEGHGPVAPARAIHFLVQLCGALGEAHAMGLVHRDIKPGNVIVCERGGEHDVIKVLDFGLVGAMSVNGGAPTLTGAGMIVGTPAFMSPEQCAGDGPVGPASDIYSVGALGYYLLTGKVPFPGRSPTQTLAAHLYEMPGAMTESGVRVPPSLQAVIFRCLAKQPGERLASVSALRDELLRCADTGLWTERDA